MFEQKMLFNKLFFNFKVKGAIRDVNISAFRQNRKKLIGNFGAIHVRIMHANFQASSLRRMRRQMNAHGMSIEFLNRFLYKISKLLPCFAQDGLLKGNLGS